MGEIAEMMLDGILDENGEWTGNSGFYTKYGRNRKKKDYRGKVKRLLAPKNIVKTIAIKKTILRFFKDAGITDVKWATTDKDLYYFCRFIVDKWWYVFKRYVENDFKVKDKDNT